MQCKQHAKIISCSKSHMLDWAPNSTVSYTGSKQALRMLVYLTVHPHSTILSIDTPMVSRST